jgi:NhaA family Na+:H+ antiporter
MKLFTKFEIKKDTISAVLLFLGVVLAFVISNNDYTLRYYREFINYKFELGTTPFTLSKTILKFVNDGLMAIFFFLLGLEMKYHLTDGEFKDKKGLILPSISAVGGFVIPALVYVIFNFTSEEGMKGWAIPVATDTAFVLAILALMGSRISDQVKVFVIGLSIIDDVLAVVVLSIFYTPNLDLMHLLLAIFPLIYLFGLNLRKTYNKYLYYIGGLILWFFIVKSGVHGTIAGIILAFFIPTNVQVFDRKIALVKEIESSIHSIVAFFILPIFAFVNCELPIKELSVSDLYSPVTLGCFFGLFLGKPLGIFASMVISKQFMRIKLPEGCNYLQFFGISYLCGIGFTLSLFIGLIAFDPVYLENQMKLGVIGASLLSGILGAVVIRFSGK